MTIWILLSSPSKLIRCVSGVKFPKTRPSGSSDNGLAKLHCYQTRRPDASSHLASQPHPAHSCIADCFPLALHHSATGQDQDSIAHQGKPSRASPSINYLCSNKTRLDSAWGDTRLCTASDPITTSMPTSMPTSPRSGNGQQLVASHSETSKAGAWQDVVSLRCRRAAISLPASCPTANSALSDCIPS